MRHYDCTAAASWLGGCCSAGTARERKLLVHGCLEPLPPLVQVQYHPSTEAGAPRMLGPVRFRQSLSPVTGDPRAAVWAGLRSCLRSCLTPGTL